MKCRKSKWLLQNLLFQYCQKLASPNFTHVKKEKEQNYAYSGKTVIVYDGFESLRAKVRYLVLSLIAIFSI